MYTEAIDILFSAKQEGIDIVLNGDQLQLKLPKNKKLIRSSLTTLKTISN
jgi:hypothetical protein